MTYKQMKQFLIGIHNAVRQGVKVSDEDRATAMHAQRRLERRAARPRRCLPNGRSMPCWEAERDTPANHVHPRRLREVRS